MGAHPLYLLRIKQVGVLVRCTQILGASDEARAGWTQGTRSSNLERPLMPPPACWDPEDGACSVSLGFYAAPLTSCLAQLQGGAIVFLYFLVIFSTAWYVDVATFPLLCVLASLVTPHSVHEVGPVLSPGQVAQTYPRLGSRRSSW